jgi:hypothetical protein
MTIGKGVGIYLLCWIALPLLAKFIALFPAWNSSWMALLVCYFVSGFILNRVVLRGLVEWHPMYNTIDNVSSGKLNSLIFWPLVYPVLFFRLLVIKHL